MFTATALIAALVVAIGPAVGENTEYRWPPPAASPVLARTGAYTPLPLLNRVPSSVTVGVPCGLATPDVPNARTTVLATARDPERAHALLLELRGTMLDIRVGETSKARLPWPASCPLALRVEGGELHLPDRTVPLDTPTLHRMPIVTGLFTSVDLSTGGGPKVSLVTTDYASSFSTRQTVAFLVTILAATLALLLLAHVPRPEMSRLRSQLGRAWTSLDRTDAVVVACVLVWWILAPAHVDDGWFWFQYRSIGDAGIFSFAFDHWGVASPTGFWFAWLAQWTVALTHDLVFARIPFVLAVLATWALCRACLACVIGGRVDLRLRWLLAAAFLVGVTAWSMTLRIEPIVALLSAACLAAVVEAVARPRVGLLGLAVICAALAAAAHPAGLVAAAPILAAAPRVARVPQVRNWRFLGGVGLVAVVGVTLWLALITLDGDLGRRLADAAVVREGELHGGGPWNEHLRYLEFEEFGGGTPARRLSLTLILLVLLLGLTRVRSIQTRVSALPFHAMGIGLALLAFVPSKWPWHFGALVPMAAVAITAEVARAARERHISKSPTRSFVALGLVVAGACAAWLLPVEAGAALDNQHISSLGLNAYTLSTAVIALGAGIAILQNVVLIRPGRRLSLRLAHPALAVATTSVAMATVVITLAAPTIDALRSDWSPVRQNLATIARLEQCGYADHLSDQLGERLASTTTPALVHPAVAMYFPCATVPRLQDGLVAIPQTVVLQTNYELLIEPSPFAFVHDLMLLRVRARGLDGVTVYDAQARARVGSRLDVYEP